MAQNDEGRNRRSRWGTVAAAVAASVLSGAARAVMAWLLDHLPLD